MSSFKELISQIRELLNSFQENINPWLDQKSANDKHAQLISIEKSITSLQKSKTPIPEPLRILKLNLINELGKYKEAEEAQSLLSASIRPYIISPKRKTAKKAIPNPPKVEKSKNRIARITLAEIIQSNILLPGTSLFRKYKGKRFEAKLNANGIIELSVNGNIEYHRTPSGAAMAATGKPQDGWIFWHTALNEKVVELDFYRKKYIAK
jgi:hypothetical protein